MFNVERIIFEGGSGVDTVTGGTGADRVWGGAGDDTLRGGTGYAGDELNGGAGADTLIGQAGTDTCGQTRTIASSTAAMAATSCTTISGTPTG